MTITQNFLVSKIHQQALSQGALKKLLEQLEITPQYRKITHQDCIDTLLLYPSNDRTINAAVNALTTVLRRDNGNIIVSKIHQQVLSRGIFKTILKELGITPKYRPIETQDRMDVLERYKEKTTSPAAQAALNALIAALDEGPVKVSKIHQKILRRKPLKTLLQKLDFPKLEYVDISNADRIMAIEIFKQANNVSCSVNAAVDALISTIRNDSFEVCTTHQKVLNKNPLKTLLKELGITPTYRETTTQDRIDALNIYKGTRNERSSNEFIHWPHFFGVSKTKKYAAVDAVIAAIQQSDSNEKAVQVSKVHQQALSQGTLKTLVKELGIALQYKDISNQKDYSPPVVQT